MDTLPTPYRPIPCNRIDGWTPARQWRFLQALADCGSVARAAASVGLSAQAAYRLRRHPAADGFRAAWDAAIADTLRRVQENILERVLHGEIETVERGGERITRHRPCAPQVAIAMLARCERLVEGSRREAVARADLVRAEAEAMAAADVRRARAAGYRGPAAAANLPPEPRSPETAGLRDFHDLLGALPDSRGWEGPDDMGEHDAAGDDAAGDDIAVPVLPMPDVGLCPDPVHLALSGKPSRLIDPVARAVQAAARAERAALAADMAKEERDALAISRIERCKVIDKYGRSWGGDYY